MTPVRVAAAMAAVLTALLLQATLIGPVAAPILVSLPAVLIGAVALHEGPSTGMALGFSSGLVADLGSHHPAGVLAVCWLGVGMACGMARESDRARWAQAAVVGVAAGAAATVAGLLIVLFTARTGALAAFQDGLPAVPFDAVLAFVIAPLVRAFLRSGALRGPQPTREPAGRTSGHG